MSLEVAAVQAKAPDRGKHAGREALLHHHTPTCIVGSWPPDVRYNHGSASIISHSQILLKVVNHLIRSRAIPAVRVAEGFPELCFASDLTSMDGVVRLTTTLAVVITAKNAGALDKSRPLIFNLCLKKAPILDDKRSVSRAEYVL